jgi:hypothetical protein
MLAGNEQMRALGAKLLEKMTAADTIELNGCVYVGNPYRGWKRVQ